MKSRRCVFALCCLALVSCSGCSALSQLAYSLGGCLDPNVQPCIDHVGDCSLCGEPPLARSNHGVEHVDYARRQGDAGAGGAVFPQDFGPQFEALRAETAGFREELDAVNQQLVQRGQALVQTRGELDRVRADVINLRGNVAQWQQSMQGLHQQIRQRDAERLAVLNDMSGSMQQIMRENVQRR